MFRSDVLKIEQGKKSKAGEIRGEQLREVQVSGYVKERGRLKVEKKVKENRETHLETFSQNSQNS